MRGREGKGESEECLLYSRHSKIVCGLKGHFGFDIAMFPKTPTQPTAAATAAVLPITLSHSLQFNLYSLPDCLLLLLCINCAISCALSFHSNRSARHAHWQRSKKGLSSELSFGPCKLSSLSLSHSRAIYYLSATLSCTLFHIFMNEMQAGTRASLALPLCLLAPHLSLCHSLSSLPHFLLPSLSLAAPSICCCF